MVRDSSYICELSWAKKFTVSVITYNIIWKLPITVKKVIVQT